ncbi:MAG: sugar phosphate isomerase/epimerase [Planctomycetaceae bacterium]|jgi:sugar phosphate isomerase/epimerase|nr:sugar phosphate isomerase/epimerase [Planctomycetaceae bacterium]
MIRQQPQSSRRRFLRTTLAVPVLAGSGISAFVAGTTGAKETISTTNSTTKETHAEISKSGEIKFQLGLASYTTRKFDRTQTLAMSRRAGLKHICLKDFHLKLTSTNEECAAAAQECRQIGINLYAGGVIYMKKPEDVENAFRYAQACGMTTIVGVPEPAVLPIVEQHVQKTGIYVAIHNHGPGDKVYPTPESIIEKIQTLDQRIGLCVDIGHTARIGVDVAETFRKYKDRLFDCHFKDETEMNPKGQTCICGRGVLDLPHYLMTLKEIGYDRIVSFEYEADEKDPLPGLMESVGYIRGILRML